LLSRDFTVTRKVNALDAAYDLRSGMPLAELMKKYGLSLNQLHSLLQSLKATKLLGVERNGFKAELVRAIREIVNAQVRIGKRYFTGRGLPKDRTEAIKWWIKAAEQGNADAQFYLGECYLKGAGVSKDGTEAAKWFNKAAVQGHPAAKERLQRLRETTR